MAAGTTPLGTDYTTFLTTGVPDASAVRWGVADANATDADIPTLIYCHGAGGSSNQFESFSAWAGLRNWLVDNGWAWIEGTGGGTEPWGNDASVLAYEASYQHVGTSLNLGPVVLLGRSMGGLVAQRLYVDSDVIAPVAIGAIINSGVQDTAWAYDYDSNRWTDAFNSAWGVTSKAQLLALTPTRNPMEMSPALWAGKNVLQLVGTSDTTVPPAANGYPMRAHLAGQLGIDTLFERVGGDHPTGNGLYTATQPMVDFLTAITGGGIVPTPDAIYYPSTAAYLAGPNRELFPISETYAPA